MPCRVTVFDIWSSIARSGCGEFVCIDTNDFGINSRCCRTFIFHIFIRIYSSAINSNTSRPSVHTCGNQIETKKRNIYAISDHWSTMCVCVCVSFQLTWITCRLADRIVILSELNRLQSLTSLTFEYDVFMAWCVTIVQWSHSNVTIVFWNDSFASFRWKYSSLTPPSKILRKYRGISVRPMAVN